MYRVLRLCRMAPAVPPAAVNSRSASARFGRLGVHTCRPLDRLLQLSRHWKRSPNALSGSRKTVRRLDPLALADSTARRAGLQQLPAPRFLAGRRRRRKALRARSPPEGPRFRSHRSRTILPRMAAHLVYHCLRATALAQPGVPKRPAALWRRVRGLRLVHTAVRPLCRSRDCTVLPAGRLRLASGVEVRAGLSRRAALFDLECDGYLRPDNRNPTAPCRQSLPVRPHRLPRPVQARLHRTPAPPRTRRSPRAPPLRPPSRHPLRDLL